MSARYDKREIVFELDVLGGVTILDGGHFIGLADGSVICLKDFKARLAAKSCRQACACSKYFESEPGPKKI